ncbi:Glycoside hydrolase, family 35 [Sesbania bispinosa]|nr:Glycoside hydrolase, family 35 [Sesbania bispinosa]
MTTSIEVTSNIIYLEEKAILRMLKLILQQDGKYYVPAWSVSILQDCKKEVFNTAKILAIVGGPVKLIGSDTNNIIDLSTSTWSYKVGLNGEAKRFYDPKIPNGVQWNTNNVPTGRPMTWYKSTFKTPEGTDSLVLDLEGLGKGHAWVNGQSIGRYWPTMVADENGCSDTCDYRGNYGPERCVSGCGEPSQRFYHVPRSFLNNDTNTLILLRKWAETHPMCLSKQLQLVLFVQTADYGKHLRSELPGWEKLFQKSNSLVMGIHKESAVVPKGEWESRDSTTVVERACIGKDSCSIDVTSSTFGIRRGGTNGQLAVQLLCDGSNPEDGRVQRVRG